MDDSYPSVSHLRRSLADTPPFRLGCARVEPALLAVSVGERVWRLEPRVMKVLVALHDTRGAVVSRDALIADCWNGRVVTDDSVQRCIAALRKLAGEIAPVPFEIETIAKVGYRLTPSPAAAAEAPAGEAPSALPALRSKRAAWTLAAAGAGAAAALLAAVFLAPSRPVEPFVAVVPLETATADPTHRALARALPQAVASDLANLGAPARFGVAADDRPAYVVEGTVSGLGGRIHALIRIVRGGSGETLWSRTFEAAPDRLDELRPAVSTAVGSAFTGPVRLFGSRREPAERLASKLRIAEHMREGRPLEALREAERLVEVAGDDPPSLALFAQGVGEALIEVPESQRPDLWRRGREAAQRAVLLDPAHGEAWAALATLVPPSAYAERLAILRQGVRRAPTSTAAQHGLALALGAVGQTAEAAKWNQRVSAADPLSRSYAQSLILAYADLHGEAGAYDALADARSRWPGDPYWDQVEVFLAARFMNPASLQRARRRLDERLIHSPAARRRLDLLGRAMADRSPDSEQAFATHCLDRSLPIATGTVCAYALAALKRHDEAFEALDIFLADTVVGPTAADRERHFLEIPMVASKVSVLFRAPFAEMRADARMWRLYHRLGLVDFWLANDEWPDFCRDRRVPVDCRAMAREAAAD